MTNISNGFGAQIHSLASDTSILKNKVAVLEDRIERDQRRNQCIVRGIPHLDNENINCIVKNICNVIGFEVGTTHINAFRLGKNRNPVSPERNQLNKRLRSASASSTKDAPQKFVFTNILLIFESHIRKRYFMGLFLSCNGINLTSIGFKSNSPIYIGDNLTGTNYKIFIEASHHKRNKKLAIVKIMNGQVLVSKDGIRKPTLITSLDNLILYQRVAIYIFSLFFF